MDILTIKSLRITGRHGIHDEERKRDTLFEVDLIFHGNFKAAGESDDLSDTINYEEAEALAEQIVKGQSRNLIESLCVEIGDSLFQQFSNVKRLEVAVRKLSPALTNPVEYSEIRMSWQR